MFESWVRPVEQIVLSTIGADQRILGFTAPESGSGVSALSNATAELFGRSGFKTLMVDLTTPVKDSFVHRSWIPTLEDPNAFISSRDGRKFDTLVAQPTASSQFAFNNVAAFRKELDKLESYDRIVIDLSPIDTTITNMINPCAAAAVCDAVFVICVKGRVTRQRLCRALDLIRAAGGNVVGTVLNEVGDATPGVELANLIGGILGQNSRLSRSLASRVMKSEILNNGGPSV
jgi:hypothetical protein